MSPDAFDIRRASERDVALVAAHRVAMFRDMGNLTAVAEPLLLAAAAEHIGEAMTSGEYVAWIAHVAGEPQRMVGGAGVQLRRLLPRPGEDGASVMVGREGIVLNVYVEPDYRRRGVARRLMEAILAWAKEAELARLVLHASDAGRPLYEELGFEQTSEMRYTGSLRR